MICQAELLTDRKIQGIQQLKGIRLEEIEKNGHISEERKKAHALHHGGNNIVIIKTGDMCGVKSRMELRCDASLLPINLRSCHAFDD